MPWRTLQISDVLNEFTPAEQAMMNSVMGTQGNPSNLTAILSDTVSEFIGCMIGAGYDAANDGTVPDQLRGHIVARARWRWLVSFPQLKALQTKERKELADTALGMMDKISRQEAGRLEPPAGNAGTGSWNSQPKLMMRTQPIPSPLQQGGQGYANPSGPTDTV